MPAFSTPVYSPDRSLVWPNSFYYLRTDAGGANLPGSVTTALTNTATYHAGLPNGDLFRFEPFTTDDWDYSGSAFPPPTTAGYFPEVWPGGTPTPTTWSISYPQGSNGTSHLYFGNLRQENAFKAIFLFGGGYTANGDGGYDRHAVLWAESVAYGQQLMEAYGYNGVSATATQAVTYDLTDYTLPMGTTEPAGVVAARMPVAPFQFTYADLVAAGTGDLGHMIGWVAANYANDYKWPARADDGELAAANYLKAGSVIRLSSSWTIPAGWPQTLKVLARTLQRYGAVLFDKNSTLADPNRGKAVISSVSDPSWPTGGGDLQTLWAASGPSLTDFEEVDITPLKVADGSIEISLAPPPVGPTALFTSTSTSGQAPWLVDFTDASTAGDAPIVSWSWDFGDGGSSSSPSPTHTFSTPGTYTITLTVTDSNGLSDTSPPETAYISADCDSVFVWDLLTAKSPVGLSPTGTITDLGGSGAEALNPGDLMFVYVRGQNSTARTVTGPVGWNQIGTEQHLTDSGGHDHVLSVWFKEYEVGDTTATFTASGTGYTIAFFQAMRRTTGTYPGTLTVAAVEDSISAATVYPGGVTSTSGWQDIQYIATAATVNTAGFYTPDAFPAEGFDYFTQSNFALLWAHKKVGNGVVATTLPTVRLTNGGPASPWMSKTFAITYCPDPPTASFTATPTSGYVPLSVTFTDTSTPGAGTINAWAWDFGDGNTSTSQNPTHTYSAAGTYTVTLTVTDTNSLSDAASPATITASDPPPPVDCDAMFEWNPDPGSAINLKVLNPSAIITLNTASLTAGDPMFIWARARDNAAAGAGTVLLNMLSSGWTQLGSTQHVVDSANHDHALAMWWKPYVVGDTTAVVSYSGAGSAYAIAVQTSYVRDVGTSAVAITAGPQGNVGAVSATYTAPALSIPDSQQVFHLASACQASTAPSTSRPTVTSSAGFTNIQGQANFQVQVFDQRVYAPAPTTVTMPSLALPGTIFEPTSPWLSITFGLTCCPEPPVASFTPDTTFGYTDLYVNFTDTSTAGTFPIASWFWDFGDGNTSTLQNPTHIYTTGGTFSVTLTVTDSEGFTDTSPPQDIQVVETVCEVGGQRLGSCVNATSWQWSVSVTDPFAVATSVEWDFGDGTVTTVSNLGIGPEHIYTVAGTYTVTTTVTLTDDRVLVCEWPFPVEPCALECFIQPFEPDSPPPYPPGPPWVFTSGVASLYAFLSVACQPVLSVDFDWGDGSPLDSHIINDGCYGIFGDPPFSHTYTANGTFTVTATWYSLTNGEVLATCLTQVTITNCLPPVPQIPDTNCLPGATLGVGSDLRVFVTNRGATQIIAELKPTGGYFTRDVDATSECEVTGTIPGLLDENCCEGWAEIYPWVTELYVWRDGRDAWSGPVTEVDFSYGQVTVRASDITAWWDRRVLPNLSYKGQDLATIFTGVSDAAMAVDPVDNFTVTATPVGIFADRTYVATDYRYAKDALDELAKTGIDWTVFGRTVIVGGETVPAQPYLTLLDDYWTTPPSVKARGNEQATYVIVKGKGVTGGAIASSDYINAFGVLVRVFDEQSIEDQATATRAANTRLAILKDQNYIETSSSATLSPNAPITVPELIPGIRVRVATQATCRPLTADFRLKKVKVDFNGQVSIDLQPLGTDPETNTPKYAKMVVVGDSISAWSEDAAIAAGKGESWDQAPTNRWQDLLLATGKIGYGWDGSRPGWTTRTAVNTPIAPFQSCDLFICFLGANDQVRDPAAPASWIYPLEYEANLNLLLDKYPAKRQIIVFPWRWNASFTEPAVFNNQAANDARRQEYLDRATVVAGQRGATLIDLGLTYNAPVMSGIPVGEVPLPEYLCDPLIHSSKLGHEGIAALIQKVI